MQRKLLKTDPKTRKTHRFVVTYDEYGVVDTIERDGVALVSTHRDAKTILRNADRLHSGFAPEGFTHDKGR